MSTGTGNSDETADRKITPRREKPLSKNTPGRERRTRHRGYFELWRPQAKTQFLLAQVDAILTEYADHKPLTVRQIFYRLVGRYGYPKQEVAYKQLCEFMQLARRSRRIPFEDIRDDGVVTYHHDWYADADAFRLHVREMAGSYRRDKLARQPRHIEVWCEAAGMMPQLARIASRYSIPVYSSGGFDSVTAKFDLSKRICDVGKPATILHLGDYDPSGIMIFRAVEEDVQAFVLADRRWLNVDVEFRRVALTREQVDRFRLPTAPPKQRGNSHARTWSDSETCQLEALAPDELAAILEDAIVNQIDRGILEEDRVAERRERRELTALLPAPGETTS